MGDLLGSPYVAPFLFASSPTRPDPSFFGLLLPYPSFPHLSFPHGVPCPPRGGARSDSIATIREMDSGSSNKNLGAIRWSGRELWLF